MDFQVVPNVEQARSAVAEVLASETFARSEQLRSFLRYVCDQTLDGHGKDINEYSVAVGALGKPAEFSPGDDSSVRRTAYELRHKLQRYYETERPDAVLRIELPRGSYTPRFVEAPSASLAKEETRPRSNHTAWILAAALAAMTIVSIILGISAVRGGPHLDPVVREAWGPVAPPGGEVLVSVATTLHLVVRPYMTVVAEGLPKYPAPPELYPLFLQRRPLEPGEQLSMHPVDNSVQMGHTQTAAIAAATLGLMGSSYQILPERSVPAPAVRGRNAILIADPQNSYMAARRLASTPLTMDFSPELQDVVVRERAGSKTVWAGKRGPDKRYAEVYGLITMLPGEGESSGPHRNLIISGLTSVGTHGAAEFFSKPDSLRILRARFASEGISGFPAAYQVVVKCRSDDTLLIGTEYVAHRVIAK